jgi:CheY-like chemotaxis protein
MSAPILLVEDNPDDVFFLKRAFNSTSVTAPLVVVSDGGTAIDYLSGAGAYKDRADHPLPALMLLDLNLPRVSGFDVLAWLRAQPALKRLPVVVLTSSKQDSDIQRAYDLGVNSYVVKPSGLKEIAEVARQIEDYWLKVNRRPSIAAG